MKRSKQPSATRTHARRDLPWELLGDLFTLQPSPSTVYIGQADIAGVDAYDDAKPVKVAHCKCYAVGAEPREAIGRPLRDAIRLSMTAQIDGDYSSSMVRVSYLLQPGPLDQRDVPAALFARMAAAIVRGWLDLLP